MRAEETLDDQNDKTSRINLTNSSTLRLLLGPGVQETILKETRPYLAEELETGGILVGRWLDADTVLIVGATGAGPHADHQRLTFAIDVAFANKCLEDLRAVYHGVDYIGEWHKHPSSFPQPSSGDFYMAKELMADPAYPDRLVNPIVVEQNGQVQINYFYLDKQSPDFIAVQPQLTQRKETEQLLKARPTSQVPPRQLGRLAKKTPAWWLTASGEQRLAQEITTLRSNGYQVSSDRVDETTLHIRAVAKNGPQPREFEFQCYGNYPLSRPGFTAYAKGKLYQQASSYTLSNWNANSSLYQVCNEVRRQASSKPLKAALWLVVGLALLIVAVLSGLLLWQTGNAANDTLTQTAISGRNNQAAAASAQTIAFANLATAQQSESLARTATVAVQVTADAAIKLTDGAIQATVTAQSQLLTALANPTPVPTALATPTPLPTDTATVVSVTPPANQLAYVLTITPISKAAYDQISKRDGHLTPFHLMLVANNQAIATQNLRLRFPSQDVYMAAEPGSPQVLTTPFNDLGLGCEAAKSCQVIVIDGEGQAVSPPATILAYDPNSYYLFTIANNP